MSQDSQSPKLSPLHLEHFLVAQSFSEPFHASEFRKRYKSLYPARAFGSILPSDYKLNRKPTTKPGNPTFLEEIAPQRYRFIGLQKTSEHFQRATRDRAEAASAQPDHGLPAEAPNTISHECTNPEAYALMSSNRIVEFWSSRRLPLEPQGHLLEARKHLRTLIGGLSGGERSILRASYYSSVDGFFDVENVLIYNLGTGTFSAVAAAGLSFRRMHRAPPVCTKDPEARYQHYHRYELVETGEVMPTSPVSETSFSLPRLSSTLKPHEVWWAAKNTRWHHIGALENGESFGLEVSITGPTQRRNLAAYLKPLFDGIICSLHHQSCAVDETAAEWIADDLGVDMQAVDESLRDEMDSLLGGKPKLVTRYRSSVAWNPDDHLCEFGSLRFLEANSENFMVEARLTRMA